MNPYEFVTSKFSDRRTYVLIYDARYGSTPTFVGTWRGGPLEYGVESIGPLLRQGLAGFSKSATWKDLASQLESNGFSQVGDVNVLRNAADVIRIVFWEDGAVSCQWFTHGPDESARSSDKPVGILPPRRGN